MSDIKVWRLFIKPQPDVNPSDGELWMWGKQNDGSPIDDEYLRKFGEKKNKEGVEKGLKCPTHPNHYVNRKRHIQKYWDYKKSLRAVAEIENFVMPHQGAWVKFYIPMPESWSQKKKNLMEFQGNEQTPDVDNFFKAFIDSLMKQDKSITDFRASKFWYSGRGHIEITLGELPEARGYTKHVYKDKIIQ